MKSPIRVRSVDHLKQLLAEGQKHYFIALQGNVVSRKTITYDADTDTFSVLHHIDGTRQKMNGRAFQRSLMWDTIQRGLFFAEQVEDY